VSCFWKGSPSDLYFSSFKKEVPTEEVQDDDIDEYVPVRWKYKSCLSVAEIIGPIDVTRVDLSEGVQGWLDFITQERNFESETFGQGYYDELWQWWSVEPSVAPILVPMKSFRPFRIDGSGSWGFPLLGGHHRLALALEHGWTHVPCFLGKPK